MEATTPMWLSVTSLGLCLLVLIVLFNLKFYATLADLEAVAEKAWMYDEASK